MINIDNFEEFIPSRILDRGYTIYSNCLFDQMYKTQNNEYYFGYHGTEFYQIRIEIDQFDNIVDSMCTCPYDYSEHCKHEVAAFFMVKFNSEEIPVHQQTIKKVDQAVDLNQILEKLNREDLEIILKTVPIKQEILENSVMNYINYSQDEHVLKFLNEYQITLGQIYSDNYYELNYQVEELDNVLNNLLKQNKTEEALALYLRIYELFEIKTKYSTNKYIKRNFYRKIIETLKPTLIEFVNSDNPFDWISYLDQAMNENTSRAIFNYVISVEIDSNNFMDAQSLCLPWLKNDEVSQDDILNYLQFIKNHMNTKDIVKHYLEYVEIETIQRELISILLESKDYNTIIKVLEDLEFKNIMISDFQVNLFDAYYLTDQKSIALNYADTKINEGSVLMFKHLKRRLPDSLFKKFIKKYDSMSFYSHSSKLEVYLNVLIEHEDTDSLFVLLQKHSSYLLEYDYALSDEDKYKLYFDLVYRTVNSNGRQNYHKAANILRELIMRGHSNVAIRIKEEIIRQFPNRPALKDELKTIKRSF